METKQLVMLAKLTNRSNNQTKELYGLCDNDMTKLMELEAKLRWHNIFATPADKQAVDTVLSLSFYTK